MSMNFILPFTMEELNQRMMKKEEKKDVKR